MPTLPSHAARRAAQRGAATLAMVLGLTLAMALATVYGHRQLFVEQRLAAQALHAAQARQAAEAGADWALAQLSQGRVDAQCRPSADPQQASFRERHFSTDADGRISLPATSQALRPGCVLRAGGLDCACPAQGVVALPALQAGEAAFRLRLQPLPGAPRAGLVQLQVTGCSAGADCREEAGDAGDPATSDEHHQAHALVTLTLALSPALAAQPQAALTVHGPVDLQNQPLSLLREAAELQAVPGPLLLSGGEVLGAGALRLQGPAGTPAAALLAPLDSGLAGLSETGMFTRLFALDPATWTQRPEVLPLHCEADCSDTLAQAARQHPGRPLHVRGDLQLSRPLALGNEQQPVLLLVDGQLHSAAGLQLHGLLVLRGSAWQAGASQVTGAVVALQALAVTGSPTLRHDPALLRRLQSTQGSFVRLPGSWHDLASR